MNRKKTKNKERKEGNRKKERTSGIVERRQCMNEGRRKEGRKEG